MIRSSEQFAAPVLALILLFGHGCTPADSADGGGTSTATFTPGSGDTLGTFSYDGGAYELTSGERGSTSIRSDEFGGFELDESGALASLSAPDGATFVVTQSAAAQTMTVDIDDPELGMSTVTVSLAAYPDLVAARRRSPGIDALQTSPSAKTSSTSASELGDFDQLDLGTFCQITRGCALAELYGDLFRDDVVDAVHADYSFLPRSFIEGRVNNGIEGQLEFCREWNLAVQELEDNPCESSDDPDPETPEDCTADGACNTNCPDAEPDPDCTNAELCTDKGFCCIGDQVCDVQRCNTLDPDCTNFDFCDRFGMCCSDDDRCDSGAEGLDCPQSDDDCSFCGAADEVCIEGCTPTDPDCPESDSCPTDDFCERDCAGTDADCALCGADESATCITNCDPVDPDCSVVTNITGEGSVSSSSVFNNESQFRASLAADGSTSTNWFSDGRGGDGPGAESEVFTWVYGSLSDTSITRIETDPETFEGGGGFGFASVQVLVQNLAGETVYDSGFLSMSGFRVDLNVSLPSGIEGRTVILTLTVHQDNSCGGFSEFRVFGIRDISEVDD